MGATGETGRAITKLNYGPDGETVVFDSEEAIDLYNFKHGIAEVVTKPKPPRLELVWRDGKTRITTDNAYLEMSTRLQMRYTHELPDDTVQLRGHGRQGRRQGVLPHPAREVQARRLGHEAVAHLRVPDQHPRGQRSRTPGRFSRTLPSTWTSTEGQQPVPDQVRSVQAGLGAARR